MIKGRGSDESAAFFIFSLNRTRFMSSVVYWSINAMASSKRPVSRKNSALNKFSISCFNSKSITSVH